MRDLLSPAQLAGFWTSATPEGDCLVWSKSKRSNGYGQLKVGGKNGRNVTAHRLAYELSVGAVPEGMLIDHICRNRACINPLHLRLATQKQNAENRDNHPPTTSGVRGVSWDSQRRRWTAALTHNYRTINLGRFTDLAEAVRVVVAARASYFTHSEGR